MRPLSPAGTAAAAVLAPLAACPSLVPRAAPVQGLLLAVVAAIAYAGGAGAARAIRRIVPRPPSHPGTPSRSVGVAAGALWGVGWLVAGLGWQRDLAALVGSDPPSWHWVVGSVVVAAALAMMMLLFARGVKTAAGRGRAAVARRAAAPAPSLTVGAAVLLAAFAVLTGSAGQAGRAGLDAVLDPVFRSANSTTGEAATQPTATGVSGGPDSTVAWEDLGRDGRDFIAATPTVARINAFSRGGAVPPIRVYVGIESAGTPEERAKLAVAELDRFGAFDREVLGIGTSTGTGTIDDNAVVPLELMYNGDSAVVASQYSVLPSFLSFLLDGQAAESEARALFAAVHRRWAALPPGDRPRLVVFGESLGAYAATAPFADLTQFSTAVDGALLAGPPHATALWRRYTDDRQPGTPQRLPVLGDGSPLRWSASPPDYGTPAAPWGPPRLAYLQNASDPVVWWSPELLWSRPDWLAEQRGADVLADLPWLPLITFLGVTGDMIDSTSVAAGHGHVYGHGQAAAWAQIIPPPGWAPSDTARLTAETEGIAG